MESCNPIRKDVVILFTNRKDELKIAANLNRQSFNVVENL